MLKKFLKNFANLQLAIFLLLLIALFSALGSIIEQEKNLNFYQEIYSKNIFFFNLKFYQLVIYFGLDHIYTTLWFFLLLVIFGLCLISCTFLQQLPTLKFARRYYFYKRAVQFKKLYYYSDNYSKNLNLIIKKFNDFQYSIFQQSRTVYAYKGLIGRIGPIIVHLSIICILGGSIIGSINGFNAQEFIPKTEIFHTQNITKLGNSAYIQQQAFRVNDFWVSYSKENKIRQFYSNISLLTGKGKENRFQTLSVNKPLVSNGLTIYQTDWGVTGIRIKSTENKEILQLPVGRNLEDQKFWLSWLPPTKNALQKGIFFIVNSDEIQLYTDTGNFISNININDNVFFNNSDSLQLIDIILSTGLQIKCDPGIIVIYTGFLFLIISSLLSYISFSELWLLESSNVLFYGGKTNRAKIKFEVEMRKIKNSYS